MQTVLLGSLTSLKARLLVAVLNLLRVTRCSTVLGDLSWRCHDTTP